MTGEGTKVPVNVGIGRRERERAWAYADGCGRFESGSSVIKLSARGEPGCEGAVCDSDRCCV